MDDEEVLAWIRDQAGGARCLFSVCTGALICGAAGLLKGRRATDCITTTSASEFSVSRKLFSQDLSSPADMASTTVAAGTAWSFNFMAVNPLD
jgi:putative intracellular protease/amidase